MAYVIHVCYGLTGTSYTLATYSSVSGIFDTVTNQPAGYSLV